MSLSSAKRNRKVRTYPGHSLEETLRVASAIHRKNADLPLNRELLAKELSTTPKSSSFTTILSASKQYGLTEGGYRDQDISGILEDFSDLGNSLGRAEQVPATIHSVGASTHDCSPLHGVTTTLSQVYPVGFTGRKFADGKIATVKGEGGNCVRE